MILAGLVADPIVFTDWDLLDLPDLQRRWLQDMTSFRTRTLEVMPYVEILAVNYLGERQYVVRPMVPCVTSLP